MTLALVIPANTSVPPFTVELPAEDPAAVLRHLVGGWLEGLPGDTDGGERVTLYVNEDGRELSLPHNPTATLLWRWINPASAGQDVVGTVVAVGVKGCDEADVPERVLMAVTKLREALRT